MPGSGADLGGAATGRALLAVFGQVHVISLRSRADRRREMTGELARIGLRPGTPEVRWFDAIRPDDAGGFPTVGTRGCFESHLAVMRLIAEGPAEAALILEDDADFRPELGPALGALAQADWDLCFGHYTGNDPDPPGAGPGLILCPPEIELVTTHFVGVRRETARRIAPYLEAILARPGGHPDGGPMHVDGAYSWFRQAHPEVRTLCTEEPVALQRSSRTDIHPLGFADRQPVLRNLWNLLRRVRRARNLHRG